MTYILTQTGQRVGVYTGTPSMDDVVLGMHRMPRFAGQGRTMWSVLDHARFAEYLARQEPGLAPAERLRLRLHALLHDAHEAITGDVPTPFKPVALKILQESLDERIMRAHAPELRWGEDFEAQRYVRARDIDHRCLLTEALLVGPSCLQTARDVHEHFGDRPRHTDIVCFRWLAEERRGEGSAQDAFFKLVNHLRQELGTLDVQ